MMNDAKAGRNKCGTIFVQIGANTTVLDLLICIWVFLGFRRKIWVFEVSGNSEPVSIVSYRIVEKDIDFFDISRYFGIIIGVNTCAFLGQTFKAFSVSVISTFSNFVQ